MGQDLQGKTVFITGASSGIGKACAEGFAKLKCSLIITARRKERLKTLANELSSRYGIACSPFTLDVRNPEHVASLLENLEIDILINNAGLALGSDMIQEGKPENWDTMIDTNIKGLLYVTRAVLPQMLRKNAGHIINIGSVSGHDCYPTGNVYCATKYAVRAISKSLRMDLGGTALRVSEVDPGAVETEFSEVRWQDKERAKKLYQGFTPLIAEDIADAVIYCATRPPHVNVAEMIVFPQAQSAISTIHRQGEKSVHPFSSK